MGNHTTTAEVDLFAPAKIGQSNTLIRHTFDGLPDNKHRVNASGSRVLFRSEAELLVIAIDLHNFGISPRAIKAVVARDDAERITSTKARLMVLDTLGAISFYDEIDDGLLAAMRAQNCLPVIMLDLHHVKRRVQQAIEHTEVRRWNFDPKDVGKPPKTQAEIKAARDAYIARVKAGECTDG